ncbi:hypothetical protein JCM15519_16040 [Fundidesulfovibrio butyratiphilus]
MFNRQAPKMKLNTSGKFVSLVVGLLVSAAVLIALEMASRVALSFLNDGRGPEASVDARGAGKGMDLFRGTKYADADPVLGYRLKKNYHVDEYTFNSLGFRDKEFKKEKDPGVFRIICLGGSTTIGSHAGDNAYTYPSLLQDLLNFSPNGGANRIEVINAGVFGYHSWHSLLRVMTELDALHPDMYIIMDGLNDIATASLMSLKEIDALRNNNHAALTRLVRSDKDKFLLKADAVLQRLATYSILKRLAAKLRASLGEGKTRNELAVKLEHFGFKQNVQAIIDHCNQRNILVMLVNYPWKVKPGTGSGADLARNSNISADRIPLYSFGRDFIPPILQSLANNATVSYVDPQPVFDAATPDPAHAYRVYSDDIHFTRYGNFLLAKYLYQAIVRLPAVQEKLGRSLPVVDNAVFDSKFSGLTTWIPVDVFGCVNKQIIAERYTCPLEETMRLSGIGSPEADAVGKWRWSLGPTTSLAFVAGAKHKYRLEYSLNNAVNGQDIQVEINGRTVKRYDALPPSPWLTRQIQDAVEFETSEGNNSVIFRFSRWNAGENIFAPSDDRPMGVAFLSLRVMDLSQTKPDRGAHAPVASKAASQSGTTQ